MSEEQGTSLADLFKTVAKQALKSLADDLQATTAANPDGLDGLKREVEVVQTQPAPPPSVPEVTIAATAIATARDFAGRVGDFKIGYCKFEGSDVHRATAYIADAINQSDVTIHEACYAMGLIIAESAMRVSIQNGSVIVPRAAAASTSMLQWLERGMQAYFQTIKSEPENAPNAKLG